MKLNNNIIFILISIILIILSNNGGSKMVNGQTDNKYINDDEQQCLISFNNKVSITYSKTNDRYTCDTNSVCVNGSLYEVEITTTIGGTPAILQPQDITCFPNLRRIRLNGVIISGDMVSYPYPYLRKGYFFILESGNPLIITKQVIFTDITIINGFAATTETDLFNFNNCEQVTLTSPMIIKVSQSTRINRLTISSANIPDLSNLIGPLTSMSISFTTKTAYVEADMISSFQKYYTNGSLTIAVGAGVSFRADLAWILSNTLSSGSLIVTGPFKKPSIIYEYPNSKFDDLVFGGLGLDFNLNGALPFKVNKNQNFRIYSGNITIPDVSQFGSNKSAIFEGVLLKGTLPEYNGNLKFLSFGSNSLTSTIPQSYCNVELDVSSNNLSGEIPECFRCYLKNTMVKSRFSGNPLLTNYASVAPCPSFAPIIKVLNSTYFFISGTNIGFSPSSDWRINNTITFWNSTNIVTKEYYGSLYYPNTFNGVGYFSMLFNAPDGRTLAFPVANTQPAPTSVTIVSSTKLQLNGTFFSTYYNYDNKMQTVTLNNNIQCTVENLGYQTTNFFGISCNFASAMPTNTDDQLLTMVTNGLTRRVFIKTTSTSVQNNVVCPKYCIDNDHGICNLNSGICTCIGNFTRDDCSGIKCPVSPCPGNGFCDYDVGKCKCNPDYQGEGCDIPYKQCPFVEGTLCNGAGTCNNVTGVCKCDDTHQGELCTIPLKQCPLVGGNACNAGGSCNNQTGICTCFSDFQGVDCSIPYKQCPSAAAGGVCNNKGSCNDQTGVCACNNDFQGVDCSTPFIECKDNCNNVGTCNNSTGICSCIPGRTLDDCSGYECVPNDCNNHGDCIYSVGECQCYKNLWYGKDCLEPYHYITSVISTSTLGGNAALFGVFSDKHDNPSALIGTLPCPITYLSSSEIRCTAPAGSGIKSVTLIQNNITFIGSDLFHYQTPIIPCPNQCSTSEINKHTCDSSTGLCSCVNGFGSFDCSTLTINGNNTEDTNNLPKSTTTIDGFNGSVNITNELTNFIINIKSLKEIDGLDGTTIVKEYPLSNKKWTIASGDVSSYAYDSLTQIISNMNSSITIRASNEPSSSDGMVKISISITNYQYSSFINTLQLSLMTSVDESDKDNQCNNNKETTLEIVSNGSDGNPVYIKISRNLKILSGKFNNLLESDGRKTYFTTTANTQPPNSIIVSLLLPHCTVECLVEADFQLLLSPDYKPCKVNSIQTNWKTPVAVCVSVVAVGALASFGFYKYKKGNSVPLRKRATTLKNMLTNKKVDLFMGDEPQAVK